MKMRTALANGALAALLMRGSAMNAQNATTSTPQPELLNVVLEMRADLLQFMMQASQNNIRLLKTELDALQQKERRVREADESRNQQLAQLDQQLSATDLESESRPQVEAVKQQLLGEGADSLRSEESTVQKRQADLTARLESELRQFQVLRQRAEQVQKALGR